MIVETQESCGGGQVHVVRATARFGISILEVQAGCTVTHLSHGKRSVCTPCEELDYIVAGLGKDPITKPAEVDLHGPTPYEARPHLFCSRRR